MAVDSDFLSEVRELVHLLARKLAPSDITYVESVLGTSLDDAVGRDPVGVFLLLLEVYLGYVQHVLMLDDIYTMFDELGFEPILDLGDGRELSLGELVRRYRENIRVIRGFYDKVLSVYGRELRKLASMVRDERLKTRLQSFYDSLALSEGGGR